MTTRTYVPKEGLRVPGTGDWWGIQTARLVARVPGARPADIAFALAVFYNFKPLPVGPIRPGMLK